MTADHRKILIRANNMSIATALITGALIFIPAGSLRFWNGWLFLAVFFVPWFFSIFYLGVKDPELLKKRSNLKEKNRTQMSIQVISFIIYIVMLVIPGLDHRFGWSRIPVLLIWLSAAATLAGFIMCIIVMRQNSYASRVIEIQDGQKLIDTGLYSFVRHPMYLSLIILFVFSPLVLGSFFGLILAVLIPTLLVIRILNEEKVLREGLPGYREYAQKVRYRLIPLIW